MRRALALLSFGLALPALAFGAVQSFGKPLAGLPRTALADVLAHPETDRAVRVEGTIRTVCQEKGCWLELADGSSSVHVTFEGYSFFVPKDSAGRKVVVEGRVIVKQLSSEEVAHKKSEGASDAVASKLSFEATGVQITE